MTCYQSSVWEIISSSTPHSWQRLNDIHVIETSQRLPILGFYWFSSLYEPSGEIFTSPLLNSHQENVAANFAFSNVSWKVQIAPVLKITCCILPRLIIGPGWVIMLLSPSMFSRKMWGKSLELVRPELHSLEFRLDLSPRLADFTLDWTLYQTFLSCVLLQVCQNIHMWLGTNAFNWPRDCVAARIKVLFGLVNFSSR
jgi:hypothetical protein